MAGVRVSEDQAPLDEFDSPVFEPEEDIDIDEAVAIAMGLSDEAIH
jgi:hypothetical protein